MTRDFVWHLVVRWIMDTQLRFIIVVMICPIGSLIACFVAWGTLGLLIWQPILASWYILIRISHLGFNLAKQALEQETQWPNQ